MDMTRGLYIFLFFFPAHNNLNVRETPRRRLVTYFPLYQRAASVLKTVCRADSRLSVLIIEYFIIWEHTHSSKPRDLIYTRTKEDITRGL